MKENKKNILITIIVVLLIILIILLFILIPKIDKNSKEKENNYIYSSEVVELPNTSIISNDELTSDHCLDGICIYDAKIYYVDNNGRVDFKIKNTSNKIKSGYLKLDFGNNYLITSYKSLAVGESIKKTTQYGNMDLSQATNFEVKKLTKEEKSNIIKSK